LDQVVERFCVRGFLFTPADAAGVPLFFDGDGAVPPPGPQAEHVKAE
jgi:hypothetical protein